MGCSEIVIIRGGTPQQLSPAATVFTAAEFKQRLSSASFFGLLFKYHNARAIVPDLEFHSNPLLTALCLRFLSRGPAWLEDETGTRSSIGLGRLAARIRLFLRDFAFRRDELRRVARDLVSLERLTRQQEKRRVREGTPVYLRTDLLFNLRAGGSVGHTAGVLNNLETLCGRPTFLTTDLIPTVL